MPQRRDLHKILIIGSGPIVIGQGCEFDYSGVQACKALKAVGYEIVLVNSNPATIMTDPNMADHIYIEPINWQSLTEIIRLERPDAIISTMGGQTALNCALELDAQGVLAKYQVELLGANRAAIEKAEDRQQFRQAMIEIGLDTAQSFVVNDMQQAWQAQTTIGYPIIIRPSYTLGGSGGGIAYNAADFASICQHGFDLSLNHQLLLEESLLGWKEFELEVIRDANDSCIIVCVIENLDPMGIHTGDSITVAPAQTLTDYEYQIMRDAAIAILRKIGVQTGGSNVQFALHPQTGRMIVIEMNPRVSRSSALASKATGFPIAKVAALLAVGYTLDELQNDITGGLIPAAFEPTIDYVVVKIPRFNFDKFAMIIPQLTTQMQSIGEVMAIGATFAAALQKALCSLELDLCGLNPQIAQHDQHARTTIIQNLKSAGALRILYVADAFRHRFSLEEIYAHTAIDPWFLAQIEALVLEESKIKATGFAGVTAAQLLTWKQLGFADARIAELCCATYAQVRSRRIELNLTPKFKNIDSCAAEFPAQTAYLYATYDGECEIVPSTKPRAIVLGSGPNRIGQGIEFDYCCVQAVQALQQHNIEAIMINCNPETVSTDYDSSDRLYFEALTLETVLDIIEVEQPMGVILQFGGQTPLKLAAGLQAAGVPILGTAPDMIDLAEDRGRFAQLITSLGLAQPRNAIVENIDAGLQAAHELGYPLMVRPSYVLGGRSMEVIYNADDLQEYLRKLWLQAPNTSILIDCFLQRAIELDVDLIADGQGGVVIAGMMEHIEPAGVHSGDSAASLPPHSVSLALQEQIAAQAIKLALALNVIGLMNIQFAIQDQNIFVLEVNPRASRTIPFISKSISVSIAKIAVACMLGRSLATQNLAPFKSAYNFAIKQSVFPFIKFPGFDPILGPEMRSTGEIMAFGQTFAEAYGKSLEAIGARHLRTGGCCYISVCADDQIEIIRLANDLIALDFVILADIATAQILQNAKVACRSIEDLQQILALITAGEINLIINTVYAQPALTMAHKIRAKAVHHKVNFSTTLAGARAWVTSMQSSHARVAYKLPAAL